MTHFAMTVGACTVTITGFARDQPVRLGRVLKEYEGPTVELTLTFPHDPPRTLNVPIPVSRRRLTNLVARDGGVGFPKDYKRLEELIFEFCLYLIHNHSWHRPYRSPTV